MLSPTAAICVCPQSIHDTQHPNENFLRLERLVARVVDPYLGYCGLYTGGRTEPEVRSVFPNIIMRNKSGQFQLSSA